MTGGSRDLGATREACMTDMHVVVRKLFFAFADSWLLYYDMNYY